MTTTELLIEYIKHSWWIWLLVICITSYYIYSYMREKTELKQAMDKKAELEKEGERLEVRYSEAAKKLEEKYSEKQKFLSSKGGSASGGKGGRK